MRGEMATIRSQFHNDPLMLLSSDKQRDQCIVRLEIRLPGRLVTMDYPSTIIG